MADGGQGCAKLEVMVGVTHPSELDAVEEMYGRVIDAMIGTPFDILWRRGEHPSREMLEDETATGNLFVAKDEAARADAQPMGAFALNGRQTSGYESVPWTVTAEPSKVCVIHSLAVDPKAQGHGVSQVLLAAAALEARRRGARALRLDVVPYNEPGIACYRFFGMHGLGIHKLVYGGFEPLPFRMFELGL